jgi:hypothetical protein
VRRRIANICRLQPLLLDHSVFFGSGDHLLPKPSAERSREVSTFVHEEVRSTGIENFLGLLRRLEYLKEEINTGLMEYEQESPITPDHYKSGR